MDECGKKSVLSTIMVVPVDKWQKKWHPSTYRPDFVDGETGLSMKIAISVDDSAQKAGLITLKEVDASRSPIVSLVPGVYFHMAALLEHAISIVSGPA